MVDVEAGRKAYRISQNLLAVTVGLSVRTVLAENPMRNMYAAEAYGAVLFLPSAWLNSSYWGQCDAIYTFYIF